jgi:hypothetical protein
LALGKTVFEAVNAYRESRAFVRRLGLKRPPSAEILCQRLDGASADTTSRLREANLWVLETHGEPLVNSLGLVRLDIDTTPIDYSGTKREGIVYTDKGFVGYHAILANLGAQGTHGRRNRVPARSIPSKTLSRSSSAPSGPPDE